MKFKSLLIFSLFANSLLAIDSDGDGLNDSVETNTGFYISEADTGTDPNNADTDGDYLKDGFEVSRGLSPVEHFDFSGNEVSYTYIPGDFSYDSATHPFNALSSITSQDAWDISNGAVVTQSSWSGSESSQVEGVIGYGEGSVIHNADSDFIFNITEEQTIKGLYIHTDGDRSTRSFQLYSKNSSGEWVERANINFMDTGIIPFSGFGDSRGHCIIFAVDFPDFIGSEFRMQFGSSYSRLVSAQPRIYEVDVITSSDSPTKIFQLIEGNYTWQEANADAEARGGRLAILNNQEKVTTASSIIPSTTDGSNIALVGGYRENSGLYWIDGSSIDIGSFDWTEGNPETEPFIAVNNNGKLLDIQTSDMNATNYKGYIIELSSTPLPPVLNLQTFYESDIGEIITFDATPTDGYPANYTYQWYFNNSPITSEDRATLSLIGSSLANGIFSVEVTNNTGTTTAEFDYRVFVDSDSDGLSDGREEFVLGTDPSNDDSDNDGLSDSVETNTGIWVSASDTGTDPLNSDSDEDLSLIHI